MKQTNKEKNSQLFITSHSPTLTSKVKFENLILLDNLSYKISDCFKERESEKIIEDKKIPDSVLDKTIKIATWNIRNFGGGRDNIYLHYIAEVLSRFELTAITELKENTHH